MDASLAFLANSSTKRVLTNFAECHILEHTTVPCRRFRRLSRTPAAVPEGKHGNRPERLSQVRRACETAVQQRSRLPGCARTRTCPTTGGESGPQQRPEAA